MNGGGEPELDPAACRSLLDKGSGCIVIDVRTPEEYAARHIAGSVNLDLASPDFIEALKRLDRAGTYIVCCRRGGRAAKAVRIMRELGFGRVYNLSGGVDRWQAEGHPVKSEG